MGDPFGTTSAAASAVDVRAPTIAIFSPPAAANTGGASPTPPMSTALPLIACSIGGPEVKSDQATLKGSLRIRPAAVSTASAPVPAWSPTCRVTPDRLAVPAVAEELPVLRLPDEHAVAARPMAS